MAFSNGILRSYTHYNSMAVIFAQNDEHVYIEVTFLCQDI